MMADNKVIQKTEEEWENPYKILVILAHPDDPEFFLGATIRRWVKLGHQVSYVLFTQGDKGGKRDITPEALKIIRQKEQWEAASVLGVESILFLNHADGFLTPGIDLNREIVSIIRKKRPDVVVTCDPTNYFPKRGGVNHPDHRAAGQIVVDAVFPAAGNDLFFPELLNDGLEPVNIKELWLSIPANPNFTLDVTPFWEDKIKALHCHSSQIGEIEAFDQRMRSRRTPDSTDEQPKYEEYFYRVIFG
jgi:LmbE family N-acetylglucosaminyl deacetylase